MKKWFSSISREEWNNLLNKSIKVWHFEKQQNGAIKPVAGKYDCNNPQHIKVSDVINIHNKLKIK